MYVTCSKYRFQGRIQELIIGGGGGGGGAGWVRGDHQSHGRSQDFRLVGGAMGSGIGILIL